jgi:peptidoglycan-associated lipoprotein
MNLQNGINLASELTENQENPDQHLGGESMKSTLWIKLAALAVISIMVFAVSCQKKTVAVQKGSVAAAKDDSYVAPAKEQSPDSSSAIGESESDKMADVVLQENIYFDFDKAILTPESRELLISNGEWLRINPDIDIIIEGHCDERGTNEYNLALGDRRAESVKVFLLDLGINNSRLKTISYGEERPSDSGHTEAAWAKNRRAHFLIE